MAVPRSVSIIIQRILDDYLPPALRDSRWFMSIPMYALFGDKAPIFLDFKKTAHSLSPEEFGAVYKQLEGMDIQGETDLNKPCELYILDNLVGKNVLEVGCGRGYLANKLAGKLKTTACDILVPSSIKKQYPNVKFQEANIERLPYKDKSFDTVVTTHTLEHVQDLAASIAELRRVTKKRLIIVVPRQRPYTYSFSLHINFFSHAWSFPALLGYRKHQLHYLGDWLYIEDVQ